MIGGCLEFTGAPFFAAMSALRVRVWGVGGAAFYFTIASKGVLRQRFRLRFRQRLRLRLRLRQRLGSCWS